MLGRREVPRRASSEAKRREGVHVKAKYVVHSPDSRVKSSQVRLRVCALKAGLGWKKSPRDGVTERTERDFSSDRESRRVESPRVVGAGKQADRRR